MTALRQPAYIQNFTQFGAVSAPSDSPEEFARFVASESVKFGESSRPPESRFPDANRIIPATLACCRTNKM